MERRPLDTFLCLVTLAYSLWMLQILINPKNHSTPDDGCPAAIPVNSSCTLLNATYFQHQRVTCTRNTSLDNAHVQCECRGVHVEYHFVVHGRGPVKKVNATRVRLRTHRTRLFHFVRYTRTMSVDMIEFDFHWSISISPMAPLARSRCSSITCRCV
jgi:hypothetical protein